MKTPFFSFGILVIIGIALAFPPVVDAKLFVILVGDNNDIGIGKKVESIAAHADVYHLPFDYMGAPGYEVVTFQLLTKEPKRYTEPNDVVIDNEHYLPEGYVQDAGRPIPNELLRQWGYSVCGFANPIVIHSGDELFEFLEDLDFGAGDAIVFHYIGHGAVNPNDNGLYYALHFSDGREERLFAADLMALLQSKEPRLLVMLHDCCRSYDSAPMTREETPRGVEAYVPPDLLLSLFFESRGVVEIFAAEEGAPGFTFRQGLGTIFSGAYFQCLMNDDLKRKKLSWEQFFAALSEQAVKDFKRHYPNGVNYKDIHGVFQAATARPVLLSSATLDPQSPSRIHARYKERFSKPPANAANAIRDVMRAKLNVVGPYHPLPDQGRPEISKLTDYSEGYRSVASKLEAIDLKACPEDFQDHFRALRGHMEGMERLYVDFNIMYRTFETKFAFHREKIDKRLSSIEAAWQPLLKSAAKKKNAELIPKARGLFAGADRDAPNDRLHPQENLFQEIGALLATADREGESEAFLQTFGELGEWVQDTEDSYRTMRELLDYAEWRKNVFFAKRRGIFEGVYHLTRRLESICTEDFFINANDISGL